MNNCNDWWMDHLDETDLKCLKNWLVGSCDKRLPFVLCFFLFIFLCLLHQSEGEERLLHVLEDSPLKWRSIAEKWGNRSWEQSMGSVGCYSVIWDTLCRTCLYVFQLLVFQTFVVCFCFEAVKVTAGGSILLSSHLGEGKVSEWGKSFQCNA